MPSKLFRNIWIENKKKIKIFKKMKKIILITLVCSILGGCNGQSSDVQTIDVNQFATKLKALVGILADQVQDVELANQDILISRLVILDSFPFLSYVVRWVLLPLSS